MNYTLKGVLMKSKIITISTTPEFERQVQKFLHGEFLKGNKTNRSELDRNAIEFYIANHKRKKKIGE